MKKKHIVRLPPEERDELEKLVSGGEARARKLMHAHILLEADADGLNWTDNQISEALSVSRATTIMNFPATIRMPFQPNLQIGSVTVSTHAPEGRGSAGLPKRFWIASKEEIPFKAEVPITEARAA
jgi:hypothetical protein